MEKTMVADTILKYIFSWTCLITTIAYYAVCVQHRMIFPKSHNQFNIKFLARLQFSYARQHKHIVQRSHDDGPSHGQIGRYQLKIILRMVKFKTLIF
jgi:hypothetical protein